MIIITKTSDQTQQRGHTLSTVLTQALSVLHFSSPLPSCVHPFASTPLPVPTPSPSPSPFTSPFPPPSPSPFPPSTLIPLLTPFLLPVSPTRLTPRYNARVQTPGLANGAVGCPEATILICKKGDAYGMAVLAVI